MAKKRGGFAIKITGICLKADHSWLESWLIVLAEVSALPK